VRVRQFNMGTAQYYDVQVDLVVKKAIHLRDNALEAARQAANKYLEKSLLDKFFFQIMKYPHLVIREHSALGVAGADRISKGMKLAFGKPKGRMAKVHAGDSVFRVQAFKSGLSAVKMALDRAQRKMSGEFTLITKDITQDPFNLSRKGKIVTFKKKEEAPKPEAVAAPIEGAPAAETGKEGEKGTPPPTAAPAGKSEEKKK
ncbi:MAG TPA: 50S ribosomal protein L16, partial [Candidatus Norongarragalinales archaeon]|nr:50S ribosomal protein L16 [Candidatus Norongarragalinales archaeon]